VKWNPVNAMVAASTAYAEAWTFARLLESLSPWLV